MPQPLTLQIEHRGQKWSAEYAIEGKVVTVDSAYGSRAGERGRRDGKVVAAELLRGLADEWRSRGQRRK